MRRPLRMLDRCHHCHIGYLGVSCVYFGDHITTEYNMYYAKYCIFLSIYLTRARSLDYRSSSLDVVILRARHLSHTWQFVGGCGVPRGTTWNTQGESWMGERGLIRHIYEQLYVCGRSQMLAICHHYPVKKSGKVAKLLFS